MNADLNISNSLKTFYYKGIQFDSKEEVMVAIWLDELKNANIIEKWEKNEANIILTTGLKIPYIKKTKLKTKIKEEKKEFILLRPSVYTPDFKVWFYKETYNKFVSQIEDNNVNKLFFSYENYAFPVIFEVKPAFDQQNMERLFILNQKFLWDKYKVFVNLVEPIELFKKTFLPLVLFDEFKYKMDRQGKWKKGDWKLKFTPKTLKEFLCQKQ